MGILGRKKEGAAGLGIVGRKNWEKLFWEWWEVKKGKQPVWEL